MLSLYIVSLVKKHRGNRCAQWKTIDAVLCKCIVPQCAMVSAVYSFDEDLIESTRGNKKRSDEDDDLWRPEGD